VARTCLHRYKDKGVAGLEDEPRSGRPPKDPLARQIVDMQASQSPPCSGHGQTCWTVATLTAFLATRFGLLLSRASVRRHLRAREQLIGLRFYLLAAYVGVEALRSLLTHEVPAASWVGDDLDLAARQQARPAARLGRQPGGAGRGAGPAPGDDGQQVPHTGAGPVDGGAAVGDCYARRALTRRRRPRLHGAGPLIEQRYMHSNGRWRRVAP
jgi:hypothetical protein